MVSPETKKLRPRRRPKPLNQAKLNDLALAYVARFATSRAKLEAYLLRKLRERGAEGGAEDGEGSIDIAAIVDRLVELKYVDDAAYARSKADGLIRRGYGARRVDQALRGAGIAAQLRDQAAPDAPTARHAALAMARKRGFGPFGAELPDMQRRERQLAAMIRAGHGFDNARYLIDAESVEAAEDWAYELDDGHE